MAGPPAPAEPDGSAALGGAASPPDRPEPTATGAPARASGSAGSWLARLTRRAARLAVLYAVLATLSLAGGLAVVAIAGEYGYQPNRDAAAWAGRTPRYGESATCRSCHGAEASLILAASHAEVSCETCHGPLEGHALAPTATTVELPVTAGGEPICLTCHEAVIGRPLTFPVISSVTHYPRPACSVCHDPHQPIAVAPPEIRHPLDGLPDCIVCHRPDGIRPMPAEHPTWDGDCRACHRSTQAVGG